MGERNPYILVDTGEGRDEYVPYLQEALTDPSRERAASEPYISDVILTHRHHDHTEGLPSVLALLRKLWDTQQPSPTPAYRPPRIHKIPLPTPDPRLNALIDRLEPGSYTPTASGSPIHDLSTSSSLPITLTSTPSESESESEEEPPKPQFRPVFIPKCVKVLVISTQASLLDLQTCARDGSRERGSRSRHRGSHQAKGTRSRGETETEP